MTYKIGTSHMCRKCGGPVIAHTADMEIARLREMIRDLCIDHKDNCRCSYCEEVFRASEPDEPKRTA